jgi:signal transduction histidine kinase
MTGMPSGEGSNPGVPAGLRGGAPRFAPTVAERQSIPWHRGLSAQLVGLTILFVMVTEVLIFVPSIAAERLNYMRATILRADLATLSLEETPNNMVSPELTRQLLDMVGVHAIVYRGGQVRRLVLADDMPSRLDVTIDLGRETSVTRMRDAMAALFQSGSRVTRLIGPSAQAPGALMEVVMDDGPMVSALRVYAGEILTISAAISLLTAALIYAILHWRLVRPMAKVTKSMVRFRRDPADVQAVVVPGRRQDEIGVAEHELAALQTDLRIALRQNQRLAELGSAVSKISHDLRNILATATLLTDRLVESADPEVQRVAPSLMRSIDRAVTLCNDTLRFGRADEAPPQRSDFDLHDLVEDVGASVGVPAGRGINWCNEVPAPFPIRADKEQVFRALLNLTRNAVQALEGRGGRVVARAAKVNGHIEIDVIDTGPGLPPKARDALFKPFASSARAGGTGLGLAIARDIARAHRGDIHLVRSDDRGTQFRLEIADA